MKNPYRLIVPTLLCVLAWTVSSRAQTLVFPQDTTWKYFIGSSEASSPDTTAWRAIGFNDSSWQTGPAPFYYETGTGFTGNTDLVAIQNTATSVYFRRTFAIADPANVASLELSGAVDDGCIIWINGVEVARPGVDIGEAAYNSLAQNADPEPRPISVTVNNLNPSILVAGNNVIAVHALNSAIASSDYLFQLSMTSFPPDLVAPVIQSVTPAPATLDQLNQVTVTFSEPVTGVNAADLLINGSPTASAVTQNGNAYTFVFPQPPYGTVQFGFDPAHGITDLGVPTNPFDETAPSASWQYLLVDVFAPYVAALFPPAGSTVTSLSQIRVRFNESVTGVDAADLLINATPATGMFAISDSEYLFEFDEPAQGTVVVEWAAGHGIRDLAVAQNSFAGGTWQYLLDPNAVTSTVIISEFMASNGGTSLVDEDGDSSDWIEIYNAGNATVNLAGWALTDSAGDLNKWRFPETNLFGGQFMIVFASGKDRRVPGAPLHTNFRLEAAPQGEYLALVRDNGTIASEFAPAYPVQIRDVSYGYAFSAEFSTLIPSNAPVRVLVPANGTLGTDWTQPAFDDSSWTAGSAPVGYETGEQDPAEDLIPVAVENLAPEGYWRFSETDPFFQAVNFGTLGNAYNGTYTGPVVLNQPGPRPPAQDGYELNNTAVQFNGSSTYVTAGGDILNNASQFTVAGWIKPSATPGSRVGLFGKNDAVEFGFISAWTLQIWTPNGGSVNVAYNTYVPNPIGEWHHVAVVGTGTQLLVYIDGIQRGSGGVSTGNYGGSTYNFCVGGGGIFDVISANGNYFNGLIDEVVAYRRALTPQEILTHIQPAGGALADYTDLINLDVQAAMHNVNSSLYLRIPFEVADPNIVDRLVAGVRYDDGFVMYLNGTEVARTNAPSIPAYNSAATDRHPDSRARQFEEINLSASTGLLQPGVNVLALHGLNISAANTDFLLEAILNATSVGLISTNQRYFISPSPLEYNGLGTEDLGPIISEVAHSPQVPNDNQDLTVTARVAPAFSSPITSFELHYRIMFEPIVTVSMFDDGQHGDGAAGDGIFGYVIPAAAVDTGEMIRYYLTATDLDGNSARWPLYEEEGPGDTEEYLGTMVNNPNLQSKLPIFQLFVEPNQWAAIDSTARPRTGGRVQIFYDGELYDNVRMGVRGNTTSGYTKKSHHLEFPREHRFRHPGPGDRVRDTSFVADYPDPSYMRQGLSFWLADQMGAPAPFYYPVLLLTNGVFYQMANHQIMIRPEITRYLGYDDRGALYQAAGTVQTSQFSTGIFRPRNQPEGNNSDYQALASSIAENRTIDQRRVAVFDQLDVPEVLNYVVTARWVHENDDVWANMTLYRDSFGDRLWRIIPFDMNLSWGAIYYEGSVPAVIEGVQATNDTHKAHPFYGGSEVLAVNTGNYNRMYDVIFDVPQTREMYLRRMRTLLDTWIKPPGTSPLLLPVEKRVRELQELMREEALRDRQKWGNPSKGGQNNFDPVYFPFDRGVDDLINLFINERRYHFYVRHSIANKDLPLGVLENNNAGIPLAQPKDAVIEVVGLDYNPASGNQAEEYIAITNANPTALDISGWKLDGAVEFTFKPGTVIPSNSVIYVSPDVNAFRARLTGPRGGLGLFYVGSYRGQLSARGESIEIYDDQGRGVSTNSYPGAPNPAQRYLRITEIMYNPSPLPGSGFMQEYPYEQNFEYLELKNIGPVALNLSGVRFANGITFNFPNVSLPAGERILVVQNQAAFTERYGSGFNIAGEYEGLLDNGGERIRLLAADGEEILDFSYNNSWYPITDGLGFSLVVVDENAEPDAWNRKSNWRPSGQLDGNPGAEDPGSPVIAPIVVNEVLTHTDPPQLDAVELYNPTGTAIDLGGWFLTDDFTNATKYRIPNGTTLGAGGYVVFDEGDFNSNPGVPPSFAFSSKGDEVFLFSGDPAGNALTGYLDGFDFGAAENGVSFGRHTNSVGDVDVVALAQFTPNGPNSGPKVGPVVISEIMYHPPDLNGQDNTLHEFIELHNTSANPVPLFDPAAPTNTWRLTDAVDFAFPQNVSLAPNGYLVVVGFDPVANPGSLAAFRTHYGMADTVPVYGPYDGKLDNSDERIDLDKPDSPELDGVPFIRVEKVVYEDNLPWPPAADGLGPSLQRLDAAAYANDPAHWFVAAPTPGAGPGAGPAPVITQQPVDRDILGTQNGELSVTASGAAPLSYQWLFEEDPIEGATGSVLSILNASPEQAGLYRVLVYNRAGAVLSDSATVRVLIPANIFLQPQPQAGPIGTNLTFTVGVLSSSPITYQWRFNGVPIPGATSNSLLVSNVQAEDDGYYDVLVTDEVGTIVSDSVRLTVLIRPGVIRAAPGYAVVQGSPVTMSIESIGTLPMGYRWRKGFATLLNEVDSSSHLSFYTIPSVQTTDAGSYSIVLTNAAFWTPGVLSPVFSLIVLADTDGDKMADTWESANGLNPNDPSDANADVDGDGFTSLEENIANTDPRNANSYLKIDQLTVAGQTLIEFRSVSNVTYTVQYKDNLDELIWNKLGDVSVATNNGTVIMQDPSAAPNRYYRLVVPRQP